MPGFAHLCSMVSALSPRRLFNFPEDLLNSLSSKGESMIQTRPRQNNDVLCLHGQPVDIQRDFIWQFPVKADELFVPRFKRHYRMTRDEVKAWDRATVPINKHTMSRLINMLKTPDHDVRAIVEGDDEFVVVFRVEADDFTSWQRECRRLKKLLESKGIASGKFLLHNLIPISDMPATPGALIYLA